MYFPIYLLIEKPKQQPIKQNIQTVNIFAHCLKINTTHTHTHTHTLCQGWPHCNSLLPPSLNPPPSRSPSVASLWEVTSNKTKKREKKQMNKQINKKQTNYIF